MNPTAHTMGRLAPSPTGAQHVGNARTYLLAWLSARSQGGRIVLRHEDIDSPRVKPAAIQQAEEDLRWLGLDWDAGPFRQTERLATYEAALTTLQAKELVYPCTCTRADVERAASAPHLDHEPPPYPGTCASRTAADAPTITDRPFSWRFRAAPVADLLSWSFTDQFLGRVPANPRFAGDFVVWKAAGTPAYQLAVVVDDHAMGVTEVIRGDDLVPSTPRQLQLYAALGYVAPSFTHVPLVVGPDGRRLAKRHGDTRLASLRAAGVTAEMMLGLLAYSCGWQDRVEPASLKEVEQTFRWEPIPREPFVLTDALLREIGYQP